MGFEWIFDVLKDLKSFASDNGMPDLANKADEAMATAKAELAARHADTRESDQLH
jgi:hypothetical protein